MNAKTVKLTTLRELVEAGSVRSAAIIGLPGGYAVQVRYGISDRALAARAREARIFSKIDGADMIITLGRNKAWKIRGTCDELDYRKRCYRLNAVKK